MLVGDQAHASIDTLANNTILYVHVHTGNGSVLEIQEVD